MFEFPRVAAMVKVNSDVAAEEIAVGVAVGVGEGIGV
jgi:hypothetical protein